MNVMQDITIDVLKPRQTVIHVVQEDSTRKIRLTLLKNNLPFDISQDLDAGETVYGFVEFRKADGHGGMYDTTSLGDPAVELEDAETATNVWIVNLDGNCFTCPGWAQINVRFETEDGKRIHTFRIMVDVEPTASSDTESTDWGELNSIADLRNAVAAMWDKMFPPDAKQALLKYLKNIACYKDENASEYYDELEAALFQTAEIVSISAVFTQGSATIYDTDDLDTLRQYLTVTATYEDLSEREITGYALSGTLEEGTSTINVSYGSKTDTFEVAVTHLIVGWYYPFNGSLLSAGTEEFGFVGNGVYAEGVNGKQCYSHINPTGVQADDTQMGLKALNVSKMPNFGGDFTWACWVKVKSGQTTGKPFFATHWRSGTQGNKGYISSASAVSSGWTANTVDGGNGRGLAGFGIQLYNNQIVYRITSQDLVYASGYNTIPPSGYQWDAWHHYAFTRKGNTIRCFVDGVLRSTAIAAYDTFSNAGQVALSAYFYQTEAQASELQQNNVGEYLQDLFVAEYCKWESDFDPNAIEY